MAHAKLLIVADDFTGGLDAGVKFAEQGISVKVVVNPGRTEDWARTCEQVIVAVTESRRLPSGEAHELVHRIVSAGRAAGIEHVYKKTDSALRGNIGAELGAALAAFGVDMLPFLPAYPMMRRITDGGIHYIDGIPVHRSVFAEDPFNPVSESDVCNLVAAQTDMPVCHTDPTHLKRTRGICVVDARSDADLENAGIRLAAMNALSVSAGCAGFAAFLPSLLKLRQDAPDVPTTMGEGLLVISGSVNPITRRQMDFAEAHGFIRVHPASVPASPGSRWMIVDANPPGFEDSVNIRKASTEARESVADALAGTLSVLEAKTTGPILITGGDTLIRCLERLGCKELKPVREVYPGVVLSIAHLRGRKRMILSKSGGFGEETLLTDLQGLIVKQASI